jgi:uncharacterized membrane protein YdjX (TVP38/TMEM64 family)
MLHRFRKNILMAWVVFVITCITIFFLKREWFSPELIAKYLLQFGTINALILYCFLSIIRGFSLLPSTVLVLVGTFLFPSNLKEVFIISLLGVLVSATLVFFFSEMLGLDIHFEEKYPKKIAWLKEQTNEKGLFVVIAWAMFPFVPTDLICYVAGALRMKYPKFILGVAIGETPIIASLIYWGKEIF